MKTIGRCAMIAFHRYEQAHYRYTIALEHHDAHQREAFRRAGAQSEGEAWGMLFRALEMAHDRGRLDGSSRT